MEEKFKMTREGKEKLEQELHDLIHNVRPDVIEELKAARAQGDLSENADYDAARGRQAEVEGQIKKLENMLANAIVIEDVGSNMIHPGSTVTFTDLSSNRTMTFSIVGSIESDPLHGKLSENCALAQALIGHGSGEEVTVKVLKPYQVKILEVK